MWHFRGKILVIGGTEVVLDFPAAFVGNRRLRSLTDDV